MTNGPTVFRQWRVLLAGTRFLQAAVGLHPQLVADRHRETDLLLERILEAPYVGEVGLDFDAGPDERRRQQDVLSRILVRCAESGGRVVSLHSRRAAAETTDLVAAP